MSLSYSLKKVKKDVVGLFKQSPHDFKRTMAVSVGAGLGAFAFPYLGVGEAISIFGFTYVSSALAPPSLTSWNRFLKKHDIFEKKKIPWKNYFATGSLFIGAEVLVLNNFTKHVGSVDNFVNNFMYTPDFREVIFSNAYSTFWSVRAASYILSSFIGLKKSRFNDRVLRALSKKYSYVEFYEGLDYIAKAKAYSDNKGILSPYLAEKMVEFPQEVLSLALRHVQRNGLTQPDDSYLGKKNVFTFVSKHDAPLENFLFSFGYGIDKRIPLFYAKKLVESQEDLEIGVKSLLAHYFSITGFDDLSDKLYEGLAKDLQQESFTLQPHAMSTTKTLQKIVAENESLSSSLLKRLYLPSQKNEAYTEFLLQKELSNLDGTIRAPRAFGFFSNKNNAGFYEQHLYDKTFRDYITSLSKFSPKKIKLLSDYVWSLREDLLDKVNSSSGEVGDISLQQKYLFSNTTFLSKDILYQAIQILEQGNFQKSFLFDYHIDNLLIQETLQKTKPVLYKIDTSLKGKTYSVIDMVNFYGLLTPLLEQENMFTNNQSRVFLKNSFAELQEPKMASADWFTGVAAAYVLKTESWMQAWSKQPKNSFHYTNRLAQLRHGRQAVKALHSPSTFLTYSLSASFISQTKNLEQRL